MDFYSQEILIPEIDEFSCRVCLESDEVNHSFKDTVECVDGVKELKELYQILIGIEMLEDNIKPAKICQSCATKLLASYEFIYEAKRTNHILSLNLQQTDDEEILNQEKDELNMEIFSDDNEIYQDSHKYKVELLLPNAKELDSNSEDIDRFGIVVNEVELDCETKDKVQKELIDIEIDEGRPFDEFEVVNDYEIDEQVEALEENNKNPNSRNAIGSRLALPTNLIFTCDQCQRSFAKEQTYQRHKETAHTYAPREEIAAKQINDHTITCPLCPRTFMHKNDLQRHMNALHPEIENTGDENENEPKKQKRQYKKGMCPHCGNDFPLASLNIHIRRHLGVNPYKCDMCEKAFPRKQDLTVHIRQHTGERPHVCTVCGKSFIRPNKLARHMRIHLGIRPYKCEECGKSFSQSNDLKIHIRRHTGEKPYACYCGEAFISGTALKQHRKLKNHNDQEERDPYEVCRVKRVVEDIYS